MLGIFFETNSCKIQTSFKASLWPCPKWNWADSFGTDGVKPFPNTSQIIYENWYNQSEIVCYSFPRWVWYGWTGSTLLDLRWSSQSNNDKSVSLYEKWTYHGNTGCVLICVSPPHHLSHPPPSYLSPSLLYLTFTFKELESHLFIGNVRWQNF